MLPIITTTNKNRFIIDSLVCKSELKKLRKKNNFQKFKKKKKSKHALSNKKQQMIE